jgi:hypothetical protein
MMKIYSRYNYFRKNVVLPVETISTIFARNKIKNTDVHLIITF